MVVPPECSIASMFFCHGWCYSISVRSPYVWLLSPPLPWSVAIVLLFNRQNFLLSSFGCWDFKCSSSCQEDGKKYQCYKSKWQAQTHVNAIYSFQWLANLNLPQAKISWKAQWLVLYFKSETPLQYNLCGGDQYQSNKTKFRGLANNLAVSTFCRMKYCS